MSQPQSASGPMMSPMPATPTISATRPTRTIVTGEMRLDVAPANPLATNEPIASASSRKPVCSASKPSTNCSQSGSVRMMPNSPSETTMRGDVAVAERRDAEERELQQHGARPSRLRRRSHAMKATRATAEIAKAIGTGERSNGQVKSPISIGVSVSHHP